MCVCWLRVVSPRYILGSRNQTLERFSFSLLSISALAAGVTLDFRKSLVGRNTSQAFSQCISHTPAPRKIREDSEVQPLQQQLSRRSGSQFCKDCL